MSARRAGTADAQVTAAVGERALPDGLGAVAEPTALRDRWWAAERAGSSRPELVEAVTDLVWAAWAGRLGDAGVERLWLVGVADGHRRELWLWLVGERTWDQALAGLAGRVQRRLPS